jgi:cell wall-associated NlpC family hydrolase
VAYSAAAGAAIAALFNPLPAFATLGAPQVPIAPAVPDIGSRPMPLGTLTMPGQPASSTPTVTPALTGVATSPILQKIEKGRAEIATMGDQLIQLGQDRDLARTQQTTAAQTYQQAEKVLRDAQTAAADAAAEAVREAAAMPPGAYDSGLLGLDDLAHLQRGEGASSEAAARQLELAQSNAQLALDAQTQSSSHYRDLVARYQKLNGRLAAKQAAQQRLEIAHAPELSAAESSETAVDSQLGASYLAGAEAGRGADARAVKALEYALAQRGDPYVWSEEGPDEYDCSGLMYAAYRSVGFQLMRVSRDQYWQTHKKVVDRYSLLPGDLLFFSYSNSWRGIHHVAMYAGNGMMVEAPRTGLNVRLVPVRWTRLFQATRVFGSVEGGAAGPVLGAPDPDTDETTPANTKPPTSPSKPPSSGASHSPSPSTSTSHSPSPSPSTSPTPTKTTPSPTPSPTTSSASPSASSTSPSSAGSSSSGGSPSGGSSSSSGTTSPSGSGSSSGSSSSSSSSASTTTSSATATASATKSSSSSSSASSSATSASSSSSSSAGTK